MISKQGENLVFLLGVPRSGTTLLSVMLDSHSMVRCPPEPWLMLALESVGRVSARSPSDAPVLYRALKEFCDPDTAIAAARQYALLAYNQSLSASGKKILVDKTPRYYLILSYLTKVFPRAKFVVLWRNPLDIAASMRSTWQVDVTEQLGAGEDHLICFDLVVGLRRLLDFSRDHADRVYTLRYEQLVRQPQKTFNALLHWLKLPVERLAGFQLGGGDFDKGDIGDKKILNTRRPHKNSIDRWRATFEPRETAVIVKAIGPHLFSAMGYGDVLSSAKSGNGAAADPAYSNSYANRLEQSLARRNSEYDAVETFSDLSRQERRLHQALLGSILTPGQPVGIDLATALRQAADAANRLSTGLADNVARVGQLEREGNEASARLDESRNLSRQQIEHATSREADWTAKFTAQHQDLEFSRSQLKRTAADHSAQCEAMLGVTRQLEEARSDLQGTIGNLADHRQRVDDLTQQLQASESRLQSTSNELAAAQLRVEELAKTVGQIRRAPVNRRPWPYAVPDAPPLPATLPGGKPWPKISVVTPSLNQGIYIEQTILSVIGQNYPNLEYIIIDGGSTDETMSVIDRFRDRISYVVSEKDSGQSNAINKGFAHASGDLLTWLNSDDMLESGALAALAMAFHTSGADLVAGVCTVHTAGVIANRHLTACAAAPLPIDDLLDLDHCWLKGQFFHQPEVMFTRDLWNRAGGGLDESLYYSMDYELWLRFAEQRARLHVIGTPIALFRVHDKQKTLRPEDYLPELVAVRDRFIQRTARPVIGNGAGNGAVPRTHLRVLFFNDIGNIGGAGIGHQRLAAAFAMAGHEVMPIAICPTLTKCQLANDTILQAISDRAPDLVFLGNIHAAQLDPAIIGMIASRWPTLLVLHDLYSLTGRCAYTGDCTRFVFGCDEGCPTSAQYPALDSTQISHAWKIKNDAMIGENPPIIAAVSNWTESIAHRRFDRSGPVAQADPALQRSSGTALDVGNAAAETAPALRVLPERKPAVVSIRSGVPTDLFKPRDQSTCRDVVKLPQDRFVVLFSSSHLTDQRKGLSDLVAALESLQLPDLLAVCIGQHDTQLESVGFEIRRMGYIEDVDFLAMLYSAADVYVGPSRVETFGQVFIEAAACGTPSVGYAGAGGVADAVAHGVSGFLAAEQTPAELARQIRKLHDAPELRRDMGIWARLWAENEFSFHATYQRIFAQLNRIGLLGKLHLPPKVSFFVGRVAPEVTYLDPQPPIPSAEHLLLQAEQRIAALQAEQDSLRAQNEMSVASLKAEVDSLLAETQSRIELLQAARDALAADSEKQIGGLETERAVLLAQTQNRIADLEAERDSLRVHLHNVTHTRLWRMVGTVYPIYQKTLGNSSIPHLARLPAQAMGQWLGKRKSDE